MKLKKIKLNKLVENSLANREMKELKGGDVACCGCGCCYEGQPGGSSSNANLAANAKSGYYSPGCDNIYTPYTGAGK